jgi:type I restriction enzyme R subunit
MPEAIDSQKFRSEIMNMDTIDRVLNTIMKEGMRLHNGETLGKTVIFCS